MRVALVLAVVALAGCSAPAPEVVEEETPQAVAYYTSTEAFPVALAAARQLDPTARAVTAEPLPRDFLVAAFEGRAPEWAFVFQFAVDERELEPRPAYTVVTVNATQRTGVAGESADEGYRVHGRAPDGRAWLPDRTIGSDVIARALAERGAFDAALSLRPDGCPQLPAAAAWFASVAEPGGHRTLVFDGATGRECRDVATPRETLPVATAVAPAEADVARGDSVNVTVRASTPEPGVGPVRLGVTAIPGFDDAMPAGVTVAFTPPQVTAAPGQAAEATLVLSVAPETEPGRYSLSVFGRDDSWRATAGFTTLLLRVR